MNPHTLELLGPVFPSPSRVAYLRVLLGRGDGSDAEAVADAWRRWREAEPSLVDALKAERSDALAATLPFLDEALKRGKFTLDAAELTRVHTARLREGLRAEAYAGVLGPLLDALDGRGVDALVLGGRPLAELLHGDASLHHSGAIDLLLRPADLDAALAVMRGAGFRDAGKAGNAPWSRHRWVDGSGLPITLATRVLPHPLYRLEEDDVWASAVEATTAGRRVRLPALHHQLALLALRGAWTGATRSLLWLFDAATLLRLGDRLDARVLVEAARRGRHALPLLAVLRWLSATFDIDLPVGIDEGLTLAARGAGLEDEEAAFALAAVACGNRLPPLLRAAVRAGRPLLPLRFGFVPSRATLEWESGAEVDDSLAMPRAVRFAKVFTRRRRFDG